MNRGGDSVDKAKEKGIESSKSLVENMKEKAGDMANQAKDAMPALPGVDALKFNITGLMDGLLSDLDGIKDSAGAEAALPNLKEMASKLDAVGPGLNALPNDQKTMIGGLVKTQLEKLNPIIERISALPGIGDAIKQILQQLKEKLTSFVG